MYHVITDFGAVCIGKLYKEGLDMLIDFFTVKIPKISETGEELTWNDLYPYHSNNWYNLIEFHDRWGRV